MYATKADAELSWTQPEPSLSLELIRQATPRGRVIDVGGGSSPLAGLLLDEGYDVAVLDVSEAALNRAKEKLGPRAASVRWIIADVTAAPALGEFDVWHDRAVFHFLTEARDRERYLALLERRVPIGGHAVVATFAEDGPEKCSGLPVRRYSAEQLAAEVGAAFRAVRSERERHMTPWGKEQSFQYSLFERI
ncbi:MAG TPA: class I SAM-dependent methyltransferase [Phycisphaerales bacterium]|nr:class I SAM-dependent methyltransferase [Phycisphaerales bacterium]